MKKILTIAVKWLIYYFSNRVIKIVEFNAYKVTFRKYTMEITTQSGNMKLRTGNMLYPNSVLYSALIAGDKNIVEWYCDFVYQFVSLITTDKGLIQDVDKAFAKYYKRLEKKSESLAKAVTPEEDKLNEDIINANIEVANMTKSERKAHRKVIKEVLTEEN